MSNGDRSCWFLCRAKTQNTTIPSLAFTRLSVVEELETGWSSLELTL
ncbi:hypothetical protein SynBIOSE41_03697 [Synechococcus sp. BIOS-E4-1]|nr:hypothetical protein SynBIOSE41_03697 [Synechococcus sp. BIOS-E4-1]